MQNAAEIRNKWFILQIKKLEESGLSQAYIAEKLDVKPQYLNAVLNGRRNASEKFIAKFCERFNINQNDLLRRMQTYEQEISIIPVSEAKDTYNKIGDIPQGAIPYWNLPVSAGHSLAEVIGASKPDGYISGLPGVDMAENILPVTGTSMEPEINPGAIIGVRKINNWDTLNTERIYLIITRDDRMIKRIEHDADNNEILWCVSPNYPRFKIYKSDIIEIQRVCFVYNPK